MTPIKKEITVSIVEVLVVLITVAGLFLWCRADTSAQITAMRSDTSAQIDTIRQDIKDFHGRLCAIEERRLKEK